jgi:hypothetical protein
VADALTPGERDLVHSDLGQLLEAVGLGDYARPESPHEVFQMALAEVGRIGTVAAAAERERVAADIWAKMYKQPHGRREFADGWETATSYASEIARNPDCEVAPLADLVRQMRLQAGEPSNSPRDWFEDGKAAERERIRKAARERLDLLGPDDFSVAAQTLADILLIVEDSSGGSR